MMAGFGTLGVLVLVLLAVASHGYPAKKGSGPSYSSSPVANHASAGSNWEAPSSGGYVPSGSGAPAHAHGASYPESAPSQPSVRRQPPAAASNAANYAAPVYPGYAGSSQGGSFQQASAPEIPWALDPPQFYSGDTRPDAQRAYASPQGHGPSHVSPPIYPVYQGGELSQYEQSYEDGDSESETEEQGFRPPPPYAAPASQQVSTFQTQPLGPGHFYPFYSYPYDYRFLIGDYPPGTYSQASSSFEQGADHWQDAHYIKYHYPDYQSTQQAVIPPLEAPKGAKQPSQPVKQSTGSVGHVGSGAARGPSQPSRGFSGHSQAGGPGSQKGGY